MEGKELLDTFGIYINKISDMEYREELLKVLIPMQHEVENAAFSEDEAHEYNTIAITAEIAKARNIYIRSVVIIVIMLPATK